MSNAFSNRIGVTIEEGIANATSIGSDVSTRNIGLLVERERGIAGKPTLTNSLKEDKRIFGDHNTSMYSSYVVENLFNNAGGYPVNLFQSRVVGANSLASARIVQQSVGNGSNVLVETTQNANLTQPQINEITFTDMEVGEQVLMSSVVGANPAVEDTFTFVDLATMLTDLTTYFEDAGYTVTAGTLPLSQINVENADNTPFTVTASNPATTLTDIFKVWAGREGLKDVGTWGNNLRIRVYPVGNVNGSNDGYLAQIFYKGYLVETYTSVGADFSNLADQINTRSEYVMVEAIALQTVLTTTFDGLLSGGVYNAPVEADFDPAYDVVTEEPLGMAVFDTIDVQIIACPEIFSTNFARLCEDFARKNLKHFIFNMPYLATEAIIETYFNILATPDQSFASGYLEWAEVPADTSGNKIWIPKIGYTLGASYIRKAGLNNGDAWTPPAGVETNAKGVYRFTHQDLNDDKKSRYVKKWRCNVIQYVKNIGYCDWSSRTYSTNVLFESTHVRLETNWLIKNVENRNQEFIQRIISPSLEKSILAKNLIWFKNLYERGGIEQSIPFADAVVITITVSKENRKEAEMDIAWIPPECLEHIHIRVNRNDGILVTNF